MPKKTFISYASKDRQTAMTICHALEARGQQCWISCRDIHPGENYQESIVKAIRGAGVMLLVFSANANNSDEIKKEIALASQSHLMVIPVRAEDVVPSEAFSYELATRQWVDLFENWDQAMAELVAQLDFVNPPTPVGDAAATQPAPAAAPQPAPFVAPQPAPSIELHPAPPPKPTPAPQKPMAAAAPPSKKHWIIITAIVLAGLAVAFVIPALTGLMLIGALIYGIVHYRNQAKAARGAV